MSERVWSGREALASLDETLAKIHQAVDALASELRRADAELAAARQAELAALARMARIRLGEIERGDLADALDEAERRVAEILAARRDAQDALDKEIAAAEERRAALERLRGERQAAVAAAAEAVDAAEAEAQTRLASDDEYRAKLAQAERSDAVADHAEDKARAAEADRSEKAKPYEADPVFAYLWARGFGTARYRAWPPARLLDGWAARSIDYEGLRRNYALLTEIPIRLREHATRMREAAERDIEAARALERRAAEAAGVPERKRRLEVAEAALAEIDHEIDEQEAEIGRLVDRRARFAAGEDDHSQQATALLRDAFLREDLSALRERAARTRSPEDDALIDDLARLDDTIERLDDERERLRRLHEAERDRTRSLEELRRRFKQSRYDDVHSTFVNAALLALLLERFVGGSVGADEVWETIRRQQRFRRVAADPLFGTGRFPRGRFPGPWHIPGGRGGWNFPGGGGFGRGGGFGGGGFGRGGGFGGGGFKTGGGF